MFQRPKEPYFVFPDILPFEEFSFEKLSSKNSHQLCLMLQTDESPFTDKRFKNLEEAKEYAEYMEQRGGYSTKHSGQDWLFLYKKEYAGILHLYDLSLETFAENHKRAWIGFATKPGLRRNGITKKALFYFIQHIFDNYPLIRYLHSMTLKENVPAKTLLTSVGFKEDHEERMSKEHAFYLMEKVE